MATTKFKKTAPKVDYEKFVAEDFDTMRRLLDRIQEAIADKPVEIQLQFIKPIKSWLFEAWIDATNPDDPLLNQSNPEGD